MCPRCMALTDTDMSFVDGPWGGARIEEGMEDICAPRNSVWSYVWWGQIRAPPAGPIPPLFPLLRAAVPGCWAPDGALGRPLLQEAGVR